MDTVIDIEDPLDMAEQGFVLPLWFAPRRTRAVPFWKRWLAILPALV